MNRMHHDGLARGTIVLVAWLAACAPAPAPQTAAPAAAASSGATAARDESPAPAAPALASATTTTTTTTTPPSVEPTTPATDGPGRRDGEGPAVPQSSGGGFGMGGSAGPLATGGSRANYGTRSLNPGFQPDPIDVDVVPGGNLEAGQLSLGGACEGYVSREPDYIVRLTGTSPTLRIYATSSADTTLLVNDPGGQWHCNDDSYGGNNPTVDLANAAPGQYDIWVGTYRAGEQAPTTLHITERGGHP